VEALLDRGANINYVNRFGKTALHYTAAAGTIMIMKVVVIMMMKVVVIMMMKVVVIMMMILMMR